MTYQGNDNFTIRMRLEVVLVLKVLANEAVVVDLAVDGEGESAIIIDEGLSTGV